MREDLPVAIWEIKKCSCQRGSPSCRQEPRQAGKHPNECQARAAAKDYLASWSSFLERLGKTWAGYVIEKERILQEFRRGRASMGTKARRGYYGLGPLDWYQAIRHRSACTKPWWNAKRPSRAACRRQARRQWNKLRRVLSEGREREWSPRRRQTELCGGQCGNQAGGQGRADAGACWSSQASLWIGPTGS